MPQYQLTKIAEFPALGGYPETEIDEEMKKDRYSPTTVGVFTIRSIVAHKSGGRWQMSVVPWGAETKIVGKNVVMVKIRGSWKKLSSLPKWKQLSSEQAVFDALLDNYDELFKEGIVKMMAKRLGIDRIEVLRRMGVGVLAGSPAGREIPDQWILNDFGHKSIKYFKDRNHDGRFNKGERLINDFMHSTPSTEVWSAFSVGTRRNLKAYSWARYMIRRATGEQREVPDFNRAFDNALLGHSHGCIHLFPHDIDTMIADGYLKKKGIIEIHPYDQSSKSILIVKRYRTLEHEVHFFPKDSKVIVFKSHKLPKPLTSSTLVAP